jgi:hypothetical protein
VKKEKPIPFSLLKHFALASILKGDIRLGEKVRIGVGKKTPCKAMGGEIQIGRYSYLAYDYTVL